MANYSTEVLADTPLVYLPLDETAGTTATDASGNARNGTYATSGGTGYLLNQTGIIPSRTGGCVKFVSTAGTDVNPSTGYVTVPYGAWANLTADHTVEYWYKPGTTRSGGTSVGHRNTLLQYGAGLFASGEPLHQIWSSDVNMGAYTSVGTGIDMFAAAPAAWHFVHVKSGSNVFLYINGILADTSVGPATSRTNTADNVGINSSGAAASSGIVGFFAGVSIYNTALSTARVAAHYTAGAGRIVLLNQQWALAAAQDMSMAATFNATTSAGFVFGAQMVLNPTFSATTNIIPAYVAAMSLAASVNATTLNTLNTVLNVAFMNTASIAANIGASGFAQMALSNIAGVSAALGLNGIMAMSLADVITAAIVIQAGDIVYNGWILNPNLVASTGLSGFAFNSFVKHKGRYYGIGDGGIYELGGPNDNGANINAFVGLPKMTFGTEKKKSVPYAYIGVSSTEKMVLRVLVGGQVYTYVANRATTEMAEQRIDIGKGLRHTYWQFELTNSNGADFELDTIKFMPIVLERRI